MYDSPYIQVFLWFRKFEYKDLCHFLEKFHFQYNMTFRLDVRWVTGELRYPHSNPDTTASLPLVTWS